MELETRRRPHRVIRLALSLGVAMLVALALVQSLSAANEQALQLVWDQHMSAPDDHPAAIKACEAFLKANPGDPLVPVVHQIEAWHQFRAGRTKEAEQLLAPYLAAPAGEIADGAKRVAQGWFSRLDRQRVADALQAYYRKVVGYPKSLADLAAHAELPKSLLPPPTDRFGKPWAYKLTGFGKLTGFEDQRYSLESAVLGGTSEFATALQAPYASGIDSPPLQVWDRTPPLVKFKLPGAGGTTAISPGQQAGDVHLAFVGERIVVICNHSYWKIFPRP